MFQYQQQPRGLRLSGVEAVVTGTVNDTVVAFTAAAVAAMTNTGTWPITGTSSWVRVLTSVADGTEFQFLRQGIYEVNYAIPYIGDAATTAMAGITVAAGAAQLIANPVASNIVVRAASAFTSVSLEGYILHGTAKIYITQRDLSTTATSTMRLQMSNGANGPPVGANVTIAQATLSIVQVNHLWGN